MMLDKRMGLDIFSFFVYALVGLMVIFCVYKGKKEAYLYKERKTYNVRAWIYYAIAFIVPVFFFTFRTIEEGYGGSDVPTYIALFQDASFKNLNINYFLETPSGEPLFTLFNCVLSLITKKR